jgi:hypothetical protein
VCGDAGPVTGSVREVRHRSFRYPGKGHLVPGSLTGPDLAIGARCTERKTERSR